MHTPKFRFNFTDGIKEMTAFIKFQKKQLYFIVFITALMMILYL